MFARTLSRTLFNFTTAIKLLRKSSLTSNSLNSLSKLSHKLIIGAAVGLSMYQISGNLNTIDDVEIEKVRK